MPKALVIYSRARPAQVPRPPAAAARSVLTSSYPAVRLDHVWKRYLRADELGIPGLLTRRQRTDRWAVADLDLQVGQGESVGLIGHNGAGKTTALKLVAGITRPTRGRVEVQGRVASLINLGAGFHRELSGRENVYLNGVLLGLSRAEVGARYEQIVAFSGLEAGALEAPVKQYSTGMYARLGFAVAAHAEPEVLLVDEVLSVGDASFQDRSMRRMVKFRESGAAIVFVSHNLSAVEMMCQRVVWLEGGRVVQVGATADVVRAYLDAVDQGLVTDLQTGDPGARWDHEDVAVEDVSVCTRQGTSVTDLEYGSPFLVRVRCRVLRPVKDLSLAVAVRGDYSRLFRADMVDDRRTIPMAPAGWAEIECLFEDLPVLPGLYRVEVSVSHGGRPGRVRGGAAFRVMNDLAEFGSQSVVGATKSRGGFLAVPYQWRITAGDRRSTLPGLHLPPRP